MHNIDNISTEKNSPEAFSENQNKSEINANLEIIQCPALGNNI